MTNISSLPLEVLLHIFSLVPDSELTSVVRTCAQWARILASRIQSSWARPGHWPSTGEVRCAAALVTSGYLPEDDDDHMCHEDPDLMVQPWLLAQ